MPDATQASAVRRFGAFEINLQAGELRKSGMRLRHSGQPFRVLAVLVERARRVGALSQPLTGDMRQAAERDSRRVCAVWNGKRAEPVAMVELQAQPMVFCYSLTGVRSSMLADFGWRPRYAAQSRAGLLVLRSRLRSLTGF
jgi:hypothetical protein